MVITNSEPKGLVINIYNGQSVPITEVPLEPTKAPQPQKKSSSLPVKMQKPKLSADEERGDALDVEMMARDSMADDEKMDLEQRIILYVRDMLKTKKVSVLRSFLDKAKHHIPKSIKDSIADEITQVKKDM